MATFQFVVNAHANSVSGGVPLDTAIAVAPGDLLTITADPNDVWTGGTGPRTSNANGLGNPYGSSFGTYTRGGATFLYGSLVGSLDGGNTFFAVGTHMAMTILVPGRVSLVYWDSHRADNSGAVTANVVLYKGPAH